MSKNTYGSVTAPETYSGKEALTSAAALIINLGPGTALAFYQALNVYYNSYFHDPGQFILRLLFLFAPFPIVFALQFKFDAKFDAVYSTHATYPWRILTMQFVLVAVTIIWIFTAGTPWSIRIIGALIGICVAIVNSSANQLIAALDPGKLVFSELGKDVGGLLPIVVFGALNFSPQDSHSARSVSLALTTILVVCVASSLCYAVINFGTASLDKGYKRLSYDIPNEDLEGFDMLSNRQSTDTTPLQSTPSDGSLPKWVFVWTAAKAVMTSIMYLALSLVPSFGGGADSQLLTVLALAMFCFGRLLTIPVRNLDVFAQGPMHLTLGSSVIVRIAVFVVILSYLGTKRQIRNILFLGCWCAMAILHQFAASLVDVTVGAYVEVKDRKFGALLCTLASYLGILLGVGFAFMISDHLPAQRSAALLSVESAWYAIHTKGGES